MKILVSDDVSEKGVEVLRAQGYDVDVKIFISSYPKVRTFL